jgi:hypothetical protein
MEDRRGKHVLNGLSVQFRLADEAEWKVVKAEPQHDVGDAPSADDADQDRLTKRLTG